MNLRISADTTTLYWRLSGEILKIEPWGRDSVRVRATNLGDFPTLARWTRHRRLRMPRSASARIRAR